MLFTSIGTESYQVAASLVKLRKKFHKLGLVTALAFLMLTGISSCSQGFIESAQKIPQTLQKISNFCGILTEKYQKRGIGSNAKINCELEANSTDGELTRVVNVEFANTLFNKLTAIERQKIAREVAELAKVHFVLDKPEDSISVSYVIFQNYAVFQSNQVIDSYTLHLSELAFISPHTSH